MSPDVLARRPEVTVFIGALGLAFSGIFFRLSHTSPETGAFYRCLFALPPLFLVMRWEERRWPGRRLRDRVFAWAAGAFFAADLLFWHHGIQFVGAGLATVLSNTQVVLIGVLAFFFAEQRPHRWVLAAIPVVCVGVVLVSGLLEKSAYGANPARGTVYGILTGIAYTGFLLVLRRGQRGIVGPGGPLFDATLSCAVVCLIVGLVLGDLDWTPSASALGWLVLLALLTQFLAWILVAISLPRLPAVVTSVSLTFQPVCTVILAALILGEAPSWLQLLGAATIVAGLVLSSLSRREAVADTERAILE